MLPGMQASHPSTSEAGRFSIGVFRVAGLRVRLNGAEWGEDLAGVGGVEVGHPQDVPFLSEGTGSMDGWMVRKSAASLG